MRGALIILALVTAIAALAARAEAHTTGAHDGTWLAAHESNFIERAWSKREKLREVRAARCRAKPEFGQRPGEVGASWRKHKLAYYDLRIRRARRAASRCGVGSASFRAWAHCIAVHESGNSNSWAGYFGFIYPPSSYIAPGPAIARQYGDDWLNVPYEVQLTLVWAMKQRYGTSPWTTAGAC